VQLTEPCKEAQKRFKTGYGRMSGGGYAHRAAWAAVHGPIPKGVLIRHLCHNPPCYEVTHLRAGTQKDNMQDSAKDGRLGKRKLDHEALVRDYLAGMRAPELAAKYGCYKTTVPKIVRRYAPEATAARHGRGRWV
jgi:Autographiviridae endonuclease